MSNVPRRSEIAKRVFMSALAGTATAALLIEPINTALYQKYMIHNNYWFDIGIIDASKISLERAPGIFLLGLLISSPLIGTAITTAVIFRSSISQHLAIWCFIAPISVWLVACLCAALPANSPWMVQQSFLARMAREMMTIDGSSFFFAPLASSVCFYCIARRANPSTATSQET